jgi:hypothetical protein
MSRNAPPTLTRVPYPQNLLLRGKRKTLRGLGQLSPTLATSYDFAEKVHRRPSLPALRVRLPSHRGSSAHQLM